MDRNHHGFAVIAKLNVLNRPVRLDHHKVNRIIHHRQHRPVHPIQM